MHTRFVLRLASLVLVLSTVPQVVLAQGTASADPAWAFRTRAVMTGVSDSSDPEGYKVYSGIGMEVDVARVLGRRWELSLTSGTHSREVEFAPPGGEKMNLGSVEVLPVTTLLRFQLHPGGRFRPYLGVGADFAVFWEKSGLLDSTDLAPSVGPVVALGFDHDISPRVVFSAEFRASRLTTDLEMDGRTIATLRLHPSTLGAGIGFRF
jgi:outer membrane protein